VAGEAQSAVRVAAANATAHCQAMLAEAERAKLATWEPSTIEVLGEQHSFYAQPSTLSPRYRRGLTSRDGPSVIAQGVLASIASAAQGTTGEEVQELPSWALELLIAEEASRDLTLAVAYALEFRGDLAALSQLFEKLSEGEEKEVVVWSCHALRFFGALQAHYSEGEARFAECATEISCWRSRMPTLSTPAATARALAPTGGTAPPTDSTVSTSPPCAPGSTSVAASTSPARPPARPPQRPPQPQPETKPTETLPSSLDAPPAASPGEPEKVDTAEGDGWGWHEDGGDDWGAGDSWGGSGVAKQEARAAPSEEQLAEVKAEEALIGAQCTMVDWQRFREHKGYRLDIARSMLESQKQESVEAGMSLATKNGMSRNAAAAHHLVWLLLEPALDVDVSREAQIVFWENGAEDTLGNEVEEILRREAMPHIAGTDHQRLALCYSAIARCREASRGAGQGKPMQGHAAILQKCATMSPGLDYKLLLQANSQQAADMDIIAAVQVLEANVTPENWAFLTKLLSKVKNLQRAGFPGTATGRLGAILLWRTFQAEAAGHDTSMGVLARHAAWAESLGVVDWQWLVQYLVCIEEGPLLPAMLRLQLLDGAMAAEGMVGLSEEAEQTVPLPGTIEEWRHHVASVVKLEAAPPVGLNVEVLDQAGCSATRRDMALRQIVGNGTPVASVGAALRIFNGGDWEEALRELYERAVQQLLAGAMVGQGTGEFTRCLRAIEETELQVGREIALVIKPSLEMCTEHSATPCAVEEAAVAFLQKYGWLD